MIDRSFYQNKTEFSYEDLVRIVRDLCDPEEGCPWDRVQTHESLIDCLIEESYETVNAIRHQDPENLREELGDVLLQVVIHSQIAQTSGEFTIDDVIRELCEKLIRRHPHVFGETSAASPDAALVSWNAMKAREKKNGQEQGKNELERVPESLPALLRARKVQKKAEENGLDVRDEETVRSELADTFSSLLQIDPGTDQEAFEECSGETLFLLTDLLRRNGVNAEKSLTSAIEKYITKTSG